MFSGTLINRENIGKTSDPSQRPANCLAGLCVDALFYVLRDGDISELACRSLIFSVLRYPRHDTQ